MNKVLLFVNGQLGLKIISILKSRNDVEISGVVVNSLEKRTRDYASQLHDSLPTIRFFEHSEELWEQSEFQDVLLSSNIAVSALFGHLIPGKIVDFFWPNIFNLHPSLLPLGRGADPIAWAIIEKCRQGVTIHVMEEKLDSGPIVSQSEILVSFGQTAGQIYDMAIEELVRLFEAFVEEWSKPIKSSPQKGKSTFHSASDLKDIRLKLIQGNNDVENSLRLIQALTFSDGRCARLKLSNGELWDVSLSMSKVAE